MGRKLGKFLMTIGLLLIAAAFLLMTYNIRESKKAEESSKEILEQISNDQSDDGTSERADEEPLYKLYPDMEMPVVTIDGIEYIGILKIPSLGIELPVAKEWNYPNLRRSPCRYEGSVYSRDIIIAGHNYSKHFGRLKTLPIGETVVFLDIDHNTFSYQIESFEIIPGTAVEDMQKGEWDLTLFTCTYGGRSRIAVRCRLVD